MIAGVLARSGGQRLAYEAEEQLLLAGEMPAHDVEQRRICSRICSASGLRAMSRTSWFICSCSCRRHFNGPREPVSRS